MELKVDYYKTEKQRIIDDAHEMKYRLVENINKSLVQKNLSIKKAAEGAAMTENKLGKILACHDGRYKNKEKTLRDEAPCIRMADFINLCQSVGCPPEQILNGRFDDFWMLPENNPVDDFSMAAYYKAVFTGKIKIKNLPENAIPLLNSLLFENFSGHYFEKRFKFKDLKINPADARRVSRVHLFDIILLKITFDISLDELCEKAILFKKNSAS